MACHAAVEVAAVGMVMVRRGSGTGDDRIGGIGVGARRASRSRGKEERRGGRGGQGIMRMSHMRIIRRGRRGWATRIGN